MSMDFGKKSSSTSTTQDQDPWDVSIPYLKTFLGKVGGAIDAPTRLSGKETRGLKELTVNANRGNPYAGQLDTMARDLMGAESYAPMVQEAYGDYKGRLTPVANGENLNFDNNPYISSMVKQAQDAARLGVNDTFAGAGRSFSGGMAGAMGKGITDATNTVLFDQFNREQGRTDAAARDLFTGGNTAATSMANLDAMRAQLQRLGVDVGDKALEARDYTGNKLLAIEKLRDELKSSDPKLDRLKQLAALLYPAGQLGQQQTGTSDTEQTSMGFGLNFL